MEEIKLAVQKREGKSTKKALSSLRAASKIPGVIYGGQKPPVQVALPEKEFVDARRRGGLNAILRLELGGETETVIVKDLQLHPVTDRPIHADFQRISLTQKIDAKVPLRIVGEAPGVKLLGGVLQHELRVLTVRALPTNIPQSIQVDISSLGIGDHIQVKDLKVASELELLDAPERMVVHVSVVKEEVAEAPAVPTGEEAAAAALAAGEAPAEPELVSTKGKKDEEGKLVKETAKAASPAPAEKGKESAKKEPAKKETAK